MADKKVMIMELGSDIFAYAIYLFPVAMITKEPGELFLDAKLQEKTINVRRIPI